MDSKLKIIACVLALAMPLAACTPADTEVAEPADPLPVVTVQDIAAGGAQSFSVLGEVTAAQSADLTAEFRATVTQVLVRPGDAVRRGERLLRLSSDSISTSASTASRTLGLAKQSLTETELASEQSIAAAKIVLTQAETALSNRLIENELSKTAADETLETAKNSLEGTIAATKVVIANAVATADKILRVSNNYIDAEYTSSLGALNAPKKSVAELAVKEALPLRDLSSSDYATVLAAAQQTEEMLSLTLAVLNTSVSGGSLSETVLSGFVTSINTQLTSVRSNLTSLAKKKNGASAGSQSIATAEAQYASTIASLQTAEDAARQAVFAAKTALSAAERQADLSATSAQTQLSSARGSATQSSINRNKLLITAHFAGTVADIPVAVGDEVNPGTVLARLENEDSLKLIAYLTRSQAAGIAVGDTVQIGSDATDVITAKAAVVDPTTRKIKIEILHKNQYLASGQFVPLVFTSASSAHGEILLPLPAVHVTSSDDFVWVVTDEHLAERRSVTLGSISGSEIVITTGLEPGDRVVVAGGRQLKDAGVEVAIAGAAVQAAALAVDPAETAAPVTE